VNLAAATFFLLSYSGHGVRFGPYRIDLNVYRIGSAVWLRGGNLYGVLPPTSSGARLPFSYPPIAAVLLAPLALVPMPLAVTLLTTVTIALTALVLRVFLTSVIATPAPSRAVAASPDLPPARSAVASAVPGASWWTVLWLLPVALFLEPVRNTLNYGQVNVALMALVSADCLMVAPRWPRGALVGVAWPLSRSARARAPDSCSRGTIRSSTGPRSCSRPAAPDHPPTQLISRFRECSRGPGSTRTPPPGR
jgi:alpha-1,2-mannosyltransferase